MRKHFLVLLLVVVQNIFAQQLQYNDPHLGKWMSFKSNTWLTKNWVMYAERNYRHYTLLPNTEQFAFRIGGFYKTDSSRFMFGAGYASFKNIAPRTESVQVYQTEMRLWQHVSYTYSINRIICDFRYRIEERVINDESFFIRHRIRFQNTIPLNKSKMEKNTLFLLSDAELFINQRDSLYNGARYSAALGYMIFSSVQLQLGYIRDFNTSFNREYFSFTFAYDVDLTKHFAK